MKRCKIGLSTILLIIFISLPTMEVTASDWCNWFSITYLDFKKKEYVTFCPVFSGNGFCIYRCPLQ